MRRSKWTFLTLAIGSIIAAPTVAASCLPDSDKKQAKIDELTLKIKEKDKLIQKAADLKAKFDALRKEKDSINKQLQSAQKTVTELESKKTPDTSEKDTQIAQLQAQITKLQEQLQVKIAENETYSQRIKELETQIAKMDEKDNDDNTSGDNDGIDSKPKPSIQPDANSAEFIVSSPYKTAYVRPPFGAQFKLNNQDIKFTTIFGHLDSPGYKDKKGYSESSISTKDPDFKTKYHGHAIMGAQEFSEFLALPNVMDDFATISSNSNIIFGGDTNIEDKNFTLQENFSDKYTPTVSKLTNSHDALTYYTSLGITNPYSQPYDKMFFKNVNKDKLKFLTTANTPDIQFKIDILKAFEDHILAEEDKELAGYNKNAKRNPLRSGLSDHAPVFTDIEAKFDIKTNNAIDKYAKGKNVIRIGHWNILKYGGETVPEFKYTSIAKVIAAGGFDILGLTEVNYGQVDKVNNILTALNQLTGSQYKMVYQDSSDASWTNDPVLNIFESQQEQVAIIYDASIVTPVAFDNGKIGHSYRKIIPSIKEIAQLKSLTEQE
ncbi:hypothetical protein ACM0IS_01755 [Mycoplasma aquilae ATCC BAA-1896]|uniref:hypothetical protein n=1 Tax=Mycoplasma aquilae TaxID=1312741 RepID=UPI003A84026F